MSAEHLHQVSENLEGLGYAHTSFNELGLPMDVALIDQIESAVSLSSGSQAAMDVVQHIDKDKMMIVQDDRCLELGRLFVKPAIELLFAGDDEAIDTWTLFGMNRYKAGGRFGPHRDYVGSTVLVFTAVGERIFDIYETAPEDPEDKTDYTKVERTFIQQPGSIMILDREKDPAHAVRLAKTDGIVAVADVKGIVRYGTS